MQRLSRRTQKILYLLPFLPVLSVFADVSTTKKIHQLPSELKFSQDLFLIILMILVVLVSRILIRITERKRLTRLLKNCNETILICDVSGNLKERITGIFWEGSLLDFFEKENHWELVQSLQTVAAMAPDHLMCLNLTSLDLEQERYYQIVLQNMLKYRNIQGISVTITDISEAKCLENRLFRSRETASHEARHDPLTSIPNRLYFNEAIKRRFARLERHKEETISLLMMDLDHFKQVNDSKGHDVGDLVLIHLSKMCSEMIRGADVFARYGGEEFICYLDDLNPKDALEVAERMRLKVEKSEDWPEGVKLTVSIGIVEFKGETLPDDLIKKADIALYKAKATGRNRVCVFDDDCR
ncbi:GGDEF domain-containing protein [Oceanispirochaeta sp.]|jgi:diguanylate cyclase (GGDEF)-like protein|uniref:GGDEF domain-containing protein n=1 Tax=Oceanispirochaeta sp. TaxID=2035350 RepID=UPI00262FD6FC|nr:GGDEF domain-containing protein [Oceanispirochaeta sp.]MDA3958513.1 GGDEF domain-containing protein [Oceanispirochaeta sp.]